MSASPSGTDESVALEIGRAILSAQRTAAAIIADAEAQAQLRTVTTVAPTDAGTEIAAAGGGTTGSDPKPPAAALIERPPSPYGDSAVDQSELDRQALSAEVDALEKVMSSSQEKLTRLLTQISAGIGTLPRSDIDPSALMTGTETGEAPSAEAEPTTAAPGPPHTDANGHRPEPAPVAEVASPAHVPGSSEDTDEDELPVDPAGSVVSPPAGPGHSSEPMVASADSTFPAPPVGPGPGIPHGDAQPAAGAPSPTAVQWAPPVVSPAPAPVYETPQPSGPYEANVGVVPGTVGGPAAGPYPVTASPGTYVPVEAQGPAVPLPTPGRDAEVAPVGESSQPGYSWPAPSAKADPESPVVKRQAETRQPDRAWLVNGVAIAVVIVILTVALLLINFL